MVYQGTVQNGVVVLANDIHLPEGTPVRVELVDQPDSATTASPAASDPRNAILFRMADYAVESGIPDLAVNIDHYLYGHPKVTDGR